jgi:hypothetical protein
MNQKEVWRTLRFQIPVKRTRPWMRQKRNKLKSFELDYD